MCFDRVEIVRNNDAQGLEAGKAWKPAFGHWPFTIDSDQDGLWDYDEFHNLSTDPTDSDSDDDGLSDGKEVIETGSNPLVFDHDRDEDGYYAFEDCEDLIETINPGATETWNGWDDDCNDVVDDSLNRADLIESSLSITSTVNWDSVNDTLRIDIRSIPSTVSKEMVWEMEGVILSGNWSENGQTLIIEEINCKSKWAAASASKGVGMSRTWFSCTRNTLTC